MPIAFSAKYQEWALQRQMPYALSFFVCSFGWCVLSALLLSGAGSRPGARHRFVQAIAIMVVGAAASCSQITSPVVVRHLREVYHPDRPLAFAPTTLR